MPTFPRSTGSFPLSAPGSFRALSRNLVEMAAVVGVVARLGRSLVLGQDPAPGPLALTTVYVLGGALILGATALHLSNYSVRAWAWRAPAFVLVEVAAEMLVSLALTALGREPWGSTTAHLHDWPVIAARTMMFRALLVLPFILLLGAIVQLVRMWMVRRRL
jgi:hypothetical protein